MIPFCFGMLLWPQHKTGVLDHTQSVAVYLVQISTKNNSQRRTVDCLVEDFGYTPCWSWGVANCRSEDETTAESSMLYS